MHDDSLANLATADWGLLKVFFYLFLFFLPKALVYSLDSLEIHHFVGDMIYIYTSMIWVVLMLSLFLFPSDELQLTESYASH